MQPWHVRLEGQGALRVLREVAAPMDDHDVLELPSLHDKRPLPLDLKSG
jgi:hypothetical protein